jgi:hypothetical protein
MSIYFSDVFEVEPDVLDKYGAFNISLVTDLPLFIDPFLLFNSKRRRYRDLHDGIIHYLRFLRDKAERAQLPAGLLNAWFRFPEVAQTWLGFSRSGNRGSGLGSDFAIALHQNLRRLFSDFGQETVTRSSHLEKLCLIKDGVGRDNISDFTTNLIKEFLCDYTQGFAKSRIRPDQRRRITVPKVRFNYETESWEVQEYDLPWINGDYVLLVPKDLLTKDDTWINKTDLVRDFERIPQAISNEELRAQINNYFLHVLPRRRDKEPTQKERNAAAAETILKFPQLIDFYIKYKEDHGDRAASLSTEKVALANNLYVHQMGALCRLLAEQSGFYRIAGDTYTEAHERIAFLKDAVENKGGHRLFYVRGKPIQREEDIHIAYRLTWFGTSSDVSREVNDGRGPADYKISRGSADKTIVEFKLATNPQLKRNLEKQTAVYARASDARRSIKVILYFSEAELDRVERILKDLKMTGSRDIVLIDARSDNKPSGSRA